MARKRSIHASEIDVEGVSWDDVFQTKSASEVPLHIQRYIKKLDTPPVNLHSFIGGGHEEIIKLCTKGHFAEVQGAVTEIVARLKSKRQKLEETTESPSDYGKNIIQREAICDHRFYHDLHVGLQVEAFGNFITAMESEEVDSCYYRVAATVLQSMSGRFENEHERQKHFINAVEGLFKGYVFRREEGAKFKTDCTVVANQRTIANWEFKNELYGISTCPVMQNQAYYIHLQKGKSDRSPTLLVNVVGCHLMQVYGAVWNGDRCLSMDPLHAPASLTFVPRDPTHQPRTFAKLLYAIKTTMDELVTYYRGNPNPKRGPYWTYGGRLYCLKKLSSINWLYEAKLDDTQEVVVKFVRERYGEKPHQVLASKSLAPKLIDCCPLSGRWCGVIMEKVEGKPIDLENVSEKLKRSLRNAVEILHTNNFVHGDLRPQNILVVEDTVRIIDFDWADMESLARYPCELNMEGGWAPSVEPGGLISKMHDLYQVQNICK